MGRPQHWLALKAVAASQLLTPDYTTLPMKPRFAFGVLFFVLALFGGGCAAPRRAQGTIAVSVVADGHTYKVRLPAGSTAQQALDAAGVELGNLDRTEPPTYTVLGDGAQVRVVRVQEKFTVREEIIPFEREVLRNEALPEGETRLIQAGENGRREVTYREVLEDGQQVSNQAVKTVVVKQPVPEIVMVGVQTPFSPQPIPGKLAYLAGGNAWVMDGNTGERRPVVTTGDLDGRVFALSPNRRFLLFTRKSKAKDALNTLWVADLSTDPPKLTDLGVKNVVHFADFAPYSSYTIAYSTVEPRPQAPGWQANNDLYTLSFSTTGWISGPRLRLEANAGGIYGWWGTTFAWAPVGTRMAFARPDAVGLYDFDPDVGLEKLLSIVPYQTRADWAWVPPLGWSPDGQVLFTVTHGGTGEGEETSPHFDLTAYVLPLQRAIDMVPDVGMFAAPTPSPLQPGGYQVAFLQAIFPQKSDISRYRLVVMDRDGSNRRVLFPPEGALGLVPQPLTWSPAPLANGHFALAVLSQGNIYLVDSVTGKAQQITGDGLTTVIAWR